MSNNRPAHVGHLIDDDPPEHLPKDLASGTQVRAVKWVPESEDRSEFPLGYELRLLIVTEPNGDRRIFPRGGDQAFLDQAIAGGRSLLFLVKQPDKATRHTYRLMGLLFRWSFNSERMMARRIKRFEDLRLRKSERCDASVRHILPEIHLPGSEEPIAGAKLVRLGMELAQDWGLDQLDEAKVIECGLLHAASHLVNNGLVIRDLETNGSVRAALLGTNSGTRPEERSVFDLIEARFLETVEKHLDSSNEEFERFLWKDVSNLVDQIAKRKPPVLQDEVRFVLNDLLWRAFTYCSQCVQMQMQAVRLALDSPLSDEERRLYGLRYDSQPWLGGLAPVLLAPRLGFMCTVLDRMGQCPEDQAAHLSTALLQALLWQNEMVANRREADRAQKNSNLANSTMGDDARGGQSRTQQSPKPRFSDLDPEWETPFNEVIDRLDEEAEDAVTARIVKSRNPGAP